MKEYLFTVFTPTHNRAQLLPRVYNSLLKQTYKNFKWLIVDDGSKDNTRDVVSQIKKESPFEIEYLYIENGFVYKALCLTAKVINTPLMVRIDDDDELIENCLEVFKSEWDNIEKEKISDIGEIRALCINDEGIISGSYCPKIGEQSIDAYYIERHLNPKTRLENISCVKMSFWKQIFYESDQKQWLFEKITNFADYIYWNRFSRLCKSRYIFIPLRLYHDSAVSLTKVNLKVTKQNMYNTVYSRYMYLNEMRDYYYKYPWHFFKMLCSYSIFGFSLELNYMKLLKSLDSSICRAIFVLLTPLCWFYSRKLLASR